MKYKVIFYRNKQGFCPVEKFLDSLPAKTAQKVTWILCLLEDENLDRIPEKYFKKLTGTDNIWECRVKFASNDYRLLGFIDQGKFIVLTHGFSKKTKKTPKRQLDMAERLKKTYEIEKKESKK